MSGRRAKAPRTNATRALDDLMRVAGVRVADLCAAFHDEHASTA